ncbi:MAG TPA: flavodoxin reductase [Bacteroides sp.]|nr:flavodoxin reductase [Bacteroides sp.]
MEKHKVKIIEAFPVTHDVRGFRLERPGGYDFIPGQATEVAIYKPEWEEEQRPFTFTSLPEDDHLEFIIKMYPSHQGMTHELRHLRKGDELIIHEVFGAIQYRDEGLFIAGGAGVTPFIAILRHLHRQNRVEGNSLIFANRSRKDIILEEELKEILGKNLVSVLSEEEADGYLHGFVTREIIEKYLKEHHKNAYVCGPEPMMDMVFEHLSDLWIEEDAIVREDL